MNFQPLQYIYRASGAADAYTMLLLHGTGGNEQDLLPLVSYFDNHFNVLSLRGNVSEQGMPRFFRRLGMGIFDEKDLVFRTHEMVAFIKELAAKEHFNTDKIIALGYSNGANIAGSTLLLHPGFLAGAILYRPMQPFRTFPDMDQQPHTPLFMSNGLQDPTINTTDTKQYVQGLQEAGLDVQHHFLPTGHNLSQEDLDLSVNWYHQYFDHGTL